jgi:hypothetical protein
MTVLCCGDRNWWDWATTFAALQRLGSGTTVVEGEARGADRMARTVAEQLGYAVRPYPARWRQYGKAAGPIRNQLMLDSNPDIELVLAFHNFLPKSKGTADMVRRAREAGIPVRVIASRS